MINLKIIMIQLKIIKYYFINKYQDYNNKDKYLKNNYYPKINNLFFIKIILN
jgi:hypothetical protein